MSYRRVLAIILATVATACASDSGSDARTVQPGAPGEPSRELTSTPTVSLGHTDADVAFMQGMIGHHAQALEMTQLLATRTNRDDMKLFAKRIDVSQTDEIKMMQRWLEERGQPVPSVHAHHEPGAKLMPGMLTPDEMARLAGATGPAFDRLFLEDMIKHHGGAIVMVEELLASPGAAQQSDIFAFASDVDADQSMEIARMQAMLAGMQ